MDVLQELKNITINMERLQFEDEKNEVVNICDLFGRVFISKKPRQERDRAVMDEIAQELEDFFLMNEDPFQYTMLRRKTNTCENPFPKAL